MKDERLTAIRERWTQPPLLCGEQSLEQAREDITYLLSIVGCNDTGSVADEFLREWNNIKGIRHARLLTAARRQQLRTRLTDSDFTANWRAGLRAVAESPFCRGQNDRKWKADIDWFLRQDTLTKLLEGKYSGSGGGRKTESKWDVGVQELRL